MKRKYIRSWDCAIINNDQLKDPMYASINKDIHILNNVFINYTFQKKKTIHFFFKNPF